MGAVTQIIKMVGDATDFNKAVAQAANITGKAFGSLANELAGRFSKMNGAAFIVDKFIEFTREAHAMAGNVSDLADSLNISVEDAQRLGVVAGQTGTKLEKLQSAISAVNELKAAAYQYDPEAMRKFAMMGIDPKRSTMEIVHAMSQATGQAAIVVDNVFGRSAKRIKETFQTMQTMGPITSQQQKEIDAVKQFDATVAELKRTFIVYFTPILVALNTMLQNFLAGFKTVKDFAIKFSKGEKMSWSELGDVFKAYENISTGGRVSLFTESKRLAKPPPTVNTLEEPPKAMPTYAPADMAAKGGALNRIGLFVGGAPNIGDRLVTIGGFQLTQLRLIRGELEKMNQ